MTDLANLRARDQITFDITDPRDRRELVRKDDGDPMTVTVYTSQSAAYREAVIRVNKIEDLTVAERGLRLLCELIVDCDVVFNGKAMNRTELADLITQPAFKWLQDQVDAAAHDQTRFFADASTS